MPGRQRRLRPSATALSALAAAVVGCTQPAESPPTPENETVNHYMTVAGQAAGFEHIGLYNTTCARMGDPTAGRERPPGNRESPETWGMEPARVFDDVYWVGEYAAFESNPGAWAVATTDGIVVLDALFDYSVESQIVGGLEKMGLDPADIRYVLISHGHRDHFGGARYLQDTYGATVLIGEADWTFINERYADRDDVTIPDIDRVRFVRDGDRLMLGDTTFNLYVTPGHTPGTVSYTFNVADNGTPHVAAVWGGTGLAFRADSPKDVKLDAFRRYNESARRFRDIVIDSGADVMLGNHSYLVLADEKNAILESRRPGEPNPYVLGPERTVNYMDVAVACSAAGLASFN